MFISKKDLLKTTEENARLLAENARLLAENEQLRAQLAECLSAEDKERERERAYNAQWNSFMAYAGEKDK